MLKDLLSGDMQLELPKYVTLDTKERDKLQQEYYKKEQASAQKKAPVRRNSSPAFFDTLFDF